MRARALLLALLLSTCGPVPLPAEGERRLDPAYVERLADFARRATGREARGPWRIRFATGRELSRSFYGRTGVGCGWPRGLCMAATFGDGVITLRDDFREGEDDHVLVHELVHAMQWAEGDLARWAREGCVDAAEPEAYAVQAAFVAETGRGWTPDPDRVRRVSRCGWRDDE